ncbi:OmpA family protein [Flavobacterium sp. TSSA_36]|uniref:OmpA family protein n=1 Tax=Flavobacterium sp. TSSA_36 TaxID=3447669 RepID=UPI003F4135E1
MKKLASILILLLFYSTYSQNKNYTIKNIEANTKYSDFGVTFYGTTEAIYASSKKVKGSRNRKWSTNNQPYLDLYKAMITPSGEFINSEFFSKEVNSKMHESNVSFTKDMKTVYFSRDNYTNNRIKKDAKGWVLIQLYKADIDSVGNWTNIVKLPFNSDYFDCGHPSLNATDTQLFFTSNRPGTYGLTDIWGVDINKNGTYGEPFNLGPNVNTVKSEMFPYIDHDDILYFSSDGMQENFGGLDIYFTKIKNKIGVEKASNLGLPLNSSKDDFALVFKNNEKTGYFSSNRDGGKGDDDIYYFEEISNPIVLKCKQIVKGVVKDKDTQQLLPGALVTLFDSKGIKLDSIVADERAVFNFTLDCDASYKITGKKENYTVDEKIIVTNNKTDLELGLDLFLTSDEFALVRGKLMIKINPIYFDLDKFYIRPDAQIELQKVVSVMKKYPKVKISLGSHTDSRGSDAYNLTLSNKRAISSKNWIVSQGIDVSRITAKGFGETELVNTCSNGINCTSEEHQENRRTEFVIVNPEVLNKQK